MACPPINGVVESILYFDDLPRAIAFYNDVMGLKPIAGDSERFRAFDSGGGHVLLLFKRGGTLAPTRVTGGIIPPHDGSGPLHIGFAISADGYEAWRGGNICWIPESRSKVRPDGRKAAAAFIFEILAII
jgi:catechol 2,3-dioxygenase-like lactoylglutathione lyase family enzyme